MNFKFGSLILIAALAFPMVASAQYRAAAPEDVQSSETTSTAKVLTLQEALEIALSENESVKVADMEIERVGYAKKGTYASLFPSIDGSGSFMRTIKKQVMYMDGDGFDFGAMIGESLAGLLLPLYAQHPGLVPPTTSQPEEPETGGSSNNEGISVGRWNSFSGGISASMPLINAQLWQSLKISGKDVEIAVEKARSSRLDMVTQVKQAFYAVLLAKEAFEVYKDVYNNAMENFTLIERKYNVQKASELDYTRAKSNVASAIPNVYNAESSVILALWQLKAVMGIDLDEDIDVAGKLEDYAQSMIADVYGNDDVSLDYNTTMRQLSLQAEELAMAVRTQKYAYLPSLAVTFAYNMNAMTNDFKFSEFKWTPYSYVGLSLQIPIFSGGKRLNQVRQTKVQAAELDLQRKSTERQLKIAIRQYLNSMETDMKSYDSAQEAVALAQKAYDISESSYELGKSTLTDLNAAQLSLTQAKLGASQAIYNFIVAKSNLEKTLGYDFIDGEGNVDLDAKISE